MAEWKNQLYFGDNLYILREHVLDESVDLIYLDPPFNSRANYNVLFTEHGGEQSAAQITAFEDTWHWGEESEHAYHALMTDSPERLSKLIEALRTFFGQSDMMAYLTMMAQRLVELHRVLKPTGTLYLHCDPTASHYLKMILDAIFGAANFRNEIIWQRSAPKGHAFTRFASAHDVLLAYGKSDVVTWNPLYTPYKESYVHSHYNQVEPETGRRFQLDNCLNPNPDRPNLTYEWHGHLRVWRWTREKMQQLDQAGRLVYTKNGMPRYKRYLDEMPGSPITSVWTDIPPINSQAQERLGYPTQKPEALLERIIQASSNAGDVILDPFCGCGTAISVAERLHRRWIGIDITHLAISLMRHRLQQAFGSDLASYEVIGDPKDLEGAKALALEDRYQFQFWALGLVDARPAQDKKKGADGGIDGYINFFEDNTNVSKKIIIQVKSGHVNVGMIRDLKGTIDREKAAIGAFITLELPTKPMLNEALAAGFYSPELLNTQFAKIQVLSIEGLLTGRQRLEYPHYGIATFKKAPRQSKQPKASQTTLPF